MEALILSTWDNFRVFHGFLSGSRLCSLHDFFPQSLQVLFSASVLQVVNQVFPSKLVTFAKVRWSAESKVLSKSSQALPGVDRFVRSDRWDQWEKPYYHSVNFDLRSLLTTTENATKNTFFLSHFRPSALLDVAADPLGRKSATYCHAPAACST